MLGYKAHTHDGGGHSKYDALSFLNARAFKIEMPTKE